LTYVVTFDNLPIDGGVWKTMKLAIAADPFAARLKDYIKEHLVTQGHNIVDVGTTDEKDVPYYMAATGVAKLLQQKEAERGILFCGTGQGVAIVAGKHNGIIAACVESVFASRMCRSINNANVLCLGAMIWGEAMAREAVDVFLATQHTEGLPELAEFLKSAEKVVAIIDEQQRK
jgi:ribose 5-phosphate isomerase B